MHPPAEYPSVFDDHCPPPGSSPGHALGERPHRPCQRYLKKDEAGETHGGSGAHVLAHPRVIAEVDRNHGASEAADERWRGASTSL